MEPFSTLPPPVKSEGRFLAKGCPFFYLLIFIFSCYKSRLNPLLLLLFEGYYLNLFKVITFPGQNVFYVFDKKLNLKAKI